MNGLVQHRASTESRAWVWGSLMGMKMYNKFQSSFAATKAKNTLFNSLIFLQNPHFAVRRLIPLFVQSIILYLAPRPKLKRRKEQHNRFWSPARINFTFRGNFRDLRVDGIIFSYADVRLMMNNWRVSETTGQWEWRDFNYLITSLRGEFHREQADGLQENF